MITIEDILQHKAKIAVIGHKVDIIGFDIDERKMEQLHEGFDATGELSAEQLAATQIDYTKDPARLRETHFHIVTVPTPIYGNNKPDCGRSNQPAR